MDPTATWKRITDALLAGDTIEAIDAAIDLSIWLNRGGAFPTVDGIQGNRVGFESMPTTAKAAQVHVWSVLSFLLALDPDDALRNAQAD